MRSTAARGAAVGTAVVLFMPFRRVNQPLAVGFVTARLVECAFIAVGIVSVLAVVTLRQDVGGAGAAAAGSLEVAGRSLVAIHDWSFLLGPGFVVGIGNGMILGYLMYAPALVPRRMALSGLIGGPLLCASGVAVLFGVFDAGSVPQALATLPEFLWELFLGIYLTARGVRPPPVLADGRTLTVAPATAPRRGGLVDRPRAAWPSGSASRGRIRPSKRAQASRSCQRRPLRRSAARPLKIGAGRSG
jgi:hypothetical protein